MRLLTWLASFFPRHFDDPWEYGVAGEFTGRLNKSTNEYQVLIEAFGINGSKEVHWVRVSSDQWCSTFEWDIECPR